jgi:hypothetical protein
MLRGYINARVVATALWAVGYSNGGSSWAQLSIRSELGFLTETRIAYFVLTPGLSPVYAAIETTNCFNSFSLQESR